MLWPWIIAVHKIVLGPILVFGSQLFPNYLYFSPIIGPKYLRPNMSLMSFGSKTLGPVDSSLTLSVQNFRSIILGQQMLGESFESKLVFFSTPKNFVGDY